MSEWRYIGESIMTKGSAWVLYDQDMGPCKKILAMVGEKNKFKTMQDEEDYECYSGMLGEGDPRSLNEKCLRKRILNTAEILNVCVVVFAPCQHTEKRQILTTTLTAALYHYKDLI